MIGSRRVSRRRALKLGAAAASLPLVHIRTAGAAGKLTVGFWDHWIPGHNDAIRKQVDAWAAREKVEVGLDFVTNIGNKIFLTAAAEALAGQGHDVFSFVQWDVQNYAEKLEPVDDLVAQIASVNGAYNQPSEYLGKYEGHWAAAPTTFGTLLLPSCARISLMKKHAGIDLREMYPARDPGKPVGAEWTYETFVKAAEACHKAGFPFALGMGTTTDSLQAWGTIFGAFGADLVDAKGKIIVDSDKMRQALEYTKRLTRFLPPDSASYDDASNNRMLISGRSALIWNPPSAWSVAKRDAPEIAADCWTFPNPVGPAGRIIPYQIYFWGIWKFAQNKSAAKSLIAHLMEKKQIEERENSSMGYDIPPFKVIPDYAVWADTVPPPGTIYNYPIRPWHDSTPYISGSSAPPEIAVQIYNKGLMPNMAARISTGQSPAQVIAWAKEELASYTR